MYGDLSLDVSTVKYPVRWKYQSKPNFLIISARGRNYSELNRETVFVNSAHERMIEN